VPSHLDELRELVLPFARQPGMHPLGLPGAWVFRADGLANVEKHSSSMLSVGVVLQGRKRVRIDGRELFYDASECIVISGEAHYESCVIQATPDEPYLSIVLAVAPDLVASTLVELAEVAPTPAAPWVAPAAAFLARVDDRVLEPLCRLVRALGDAAERHIVAPLALRELVFRLLQSDAATALRRAACRGGDEGRILAVMQFMREHAARKLTVEALAKRARMSPSHFAHRFRDVASVSPMRYLKHLRLEQARIALVRDGLRAAEAAERSGYASAAHFTRDFKQHFGVSPTQFLRAGIVARSTIAGSGKDPAALVVAARRVPA
jgi:AraC-like DNA-binding protein